MKNQNIIIYLVILLILVPWLGQAVSSDFTITIEPLPECNDTQDNDGDGQIDYPADPECDSLGDDREAPNPQCSNGLDDDGDTLIDYPADPGCQDTDDNDETNSSAQCANGLDDDNDGLIDYPADPGCSSNSDDSEGASGGGGGGDGGFYIIPVTTVTFSGYAYPLSQVSVLKDGQLAITTIAGPDAKFSISLSGLGSGNYTFALYSEDSVGRRSTLFTFPAYITNGASTHVSGIFLAPTIATDKEAVKQGDKITIFGQSVPNSDLTIAIYSENEIYLNTTANDDGVYFYEYNTSNLQLGEHETQSKSATNGQISPFSNLVYFQVGDDNIDRGTGICTDLPADLNCDSRVNLVDFSIAAYWYKRPLSQEFVIKEQEQLSNDGKVDLVDFSIMAYYWTG